MAFLEVDHLAKWYGDGPGRVEIFKDLSFQLEEGTSLAVMGPSGSGKSTLLHLLGGLDQPSAGRILWKGKELAQLSPKEKATFRNRHLGFVFQDHYLLPPLTALENVMLPAMAFPEGKKESRQKAMDWLEKVGLKERAQHRPADLSGGEKQRVAIARALMNEPELLLCDEPTGNLDQNTSQEIAQLFEELLKDGKRGLLTVTHDPHFAETFQNTWCLDQGKLAEAS